ncbi:hypothetical protein CN273_27025 [Bacillus thuringiensis]|nr:hypothetical protein CN273_27025 [Bacillus thuringiensis]
MQIKEKIKDHRLILCFIAFSYIIKIFIFDFTGKLKGKIVIINRNLSDNVDRRERLKMIVEFEFLDMSKTRVYEKERLYDNFGGPILDVGKLYTLKAMHIR